MCELTKNCLNCGKLMDIHRQMKIKGKIYCDKSKERKYCSVKCAGCEKRRTNVICEHCKKDFYPSNNFQKFCSQKCSGLTNQTCVKSKSWTYIKTHTHKKINTNCTICDCLLQNVGFATKYCDSCNKNIDKLRDKVRYKNRAIKHRDRAYKIKRILMSLLGGKCEKCGYNKCERAMTFHHINPKTKLFTLDSTTITRKSWEEMLLEVDKCQLLCFNCHMEHHY